METFKAKEFGYSILRESPNTSVPFFPYLRTPDGDKTLYNIGITHGRSYVIGQFNQRWVVSKGNGLSYTQYDFLNTREFGDDTWGLLLKQDAIRDFDLGQEIASLGVKTNRMQYVGQIQHSVLLTNGHSVKPTLLQYSVECPYRISDFAFIPRSVVDEELEKWQSYNNEHYSLNHLIAAEILIKNLRTLQDKGILYNAFHEQNYTWALELLDFELACSPSHPYQKEDDQRHVKDMMPREVLQNYQIIKYIANCLREPISYHKIDEIFAKYGFEISSYKLSLE